MDPQVQQYIDDKLKAIQQQYLAIEDLFLNHQHRGPSHDQTKPVFPGLFAGTMASGGTAGVPFPLKWSVSKSATGVYDFVHTIGSTKYIVVAMPQAKVYAQLSAKSETGFTIKTFNDAGTATDSALDFMLVSFA